MRAIFGATTLQILQTTELENFGTPIWTSSLTTLCGCEGTDLVAGEPLPTVYHIRSRAEGGTLESWVAPADGLRTTARYGSAEVVGGVCWSPTELLGR